jgi:hypothetical protein
MTVQGREKPVIAQATEHAVGTKWACDVSTVLVNRTLASAAVEFGHAGEGATRKCICCVFIQHDRLIKVQAIMPEVVLVLENT